MLVARLSMLGGGTSTLSPPGWVLTRDARVEHLVEELVQRDVVLLEDRLGDLVAEVGLQHDVELREELDDHQGSVSFSAVAT